MVRPVVKRLSERKLAQVRLAAMALGECPEDGPELLHVLSMFFLWDPIWINSHSKCSHYRL